MRAAHRQIPIAVANDFMFGFPWRIRRRPEPPYSECSIRCAPEWPPWLILLIAVIQHPQSVIGRNESRVRAERFRDGGQEPGRGVVRAVFAVNDAVGDINARMDNRTR